MSGFFILREFHAAHAQLVRNAIKSSAADSESVINVAPSPSLSETPMISQPVGMNPQLCKDVRFLVVDDQPHMSELVDLVITALGAKCVVRVDCGRKALAAMERDVPDVLITDYQMDDLDGVALTRAAKAIAGHQVHIIMVTGKKDIEQAAREAGVDVFIVKPMWTKALFEALRAFVGQRSNR